MDRRVGELPVTVLAIRDHVAVAGDDDGNDVHLGLNGGLQLLPDLGRAI
jgi:hypothetical protein